MHQCMPLKKHLLYIAETYKKIAGIIIVFYPSINSFNYNMHYTITLLGKQG
jgi:hypothetical protein